ncbi:response regulator transcription factor [Chitinibacter bivalviorum]|uniref:Response regulator transcription factor n=1 Tax=Chitinibacter bivalviorum TaxID=2739434 RepID=A0A7H9BGN8_9NEIS|nr:response regulator transcription factor [Chitinibacter bivalviorum]QLG87777.1 response regulator transcription factor [Chitinibacter bivalviorum]
MFIAIVEDDPIQAEMLALTLTSGGHESRVFHTSLAFFDELKGTHFDLLLLDWNLPDYSGGMIIKWVRENIGWQIPIMVATAVEEESNVVAALKAGADDYLIKPIKPLEILARIDVLGRRFKSIAPQILHLGDYEIDTSQRAIRKMGNEIELTQKEFDLALYLFQHPGKLFSRMNLLEKIWGLQVEIDTRTVDTHISRLRRKLALDGQLKWQLTSVYGYGYRLESVEMVTP